MFQDLCLSVSHEIVVCYFHFINLLCFCVKIWQIVLIILHSHVHAFTSCHQAAIWFHEMVCENLCARIREWKWDDNEKEKFTTAFHQRKCLVSVMHGNTLHEEQTVHIRSCMLCYGWFVLNLNRFSIFSFGTRSTKSVQGNSIK